MVLNDRKLKILEAIINDYIITAEPVGSRTLEKKYDIGISAATIRNEMSDLEDMGFIFQPHTSSGRIPSDKGYRLYVDSIMNNLELDQDETDFLRDIINNNIDQIDYLIKEAAKAISILTKYTTIVSEPILKKIIVRYVQILPFDSAAVLLILVLDSKLIKNHILKINNPPDQDVLAYLSCALNQAISGKNFDQNTIKHAKKIFYKLGYRDKTILSLIDDVMIMVASESNVEIYTSGIKNILAYPEFTDIEKAKQIFQALEEKNILVTLLGSADCKDIEIVIGNENSIEQVKSCSIIKGRYRLGDQVYGTIGILGPTRMNYAQSVSVLNTIEKSINKALDTFC